MSPAASEDAAELLGWSERPSTHTLRDGTLVALYVQFSPDGAAVSDLGHTLASLGRLTPEARAEVRRICLNNDVQLDRGALLTHVPPGSEVGEAVERLGRVCAQISRTASEDASPAP